MVRQYWKYLFVFSQQFGWGPEQVKALTEEEFTYYVAGFEQMKKEAEKK